jgi:hypothetical protein
MYFAPISAATTWRGVPRSKSQSNRKHAYSAGIKQAKEDCAFSVSAAWKSFCMTLTEVSKARQSERCSALWPVPRARAQATRERRTPQK